MAQIPPSDSVSYMAAIIDDLVQDHMRFQRYLDRYETEIAKLGTGVSPNYDLLRLLSEYFSLFPDEMHHRKEDLVYDALAAYAPRNDHALEDLRSEHEKISRLAKFFARQVAGVLNDEELPVSAMVGSAREYIGALTNHMRKEEDVFFPQAVVMLKDRDWENICTRTADLFSEALYADKAKEISKIEATIDEYFS